MLAADEKPAFADVDRVRLVFVDGAFAPELSDAPELAAWITLSRVLLNLDEVITRE